jgi:hypothetical protein
MGLHRCEGSSHARPQPGPSENNARRTSERHHQLMEAFGERFVAASARLRGLSVYREPDDASGRWFANIYFGQDCRKLEGFSSAEDALAAGLIDFLRSRGALLDARPPVHRRRSQTRLTRFRPECRALSSATRAARGRHADARTLRQCDRQLSVYVKRQTAGHGSYVEGPARNRHRPLGDSALTARSCACTLSGRGDLWPSLQDCGFRALGTQAVAGCSAFATFSL